MKWQIHIEHASSGPDWIWYAKVEGLGIEHSGFEPSKMAACAAVTKVLITVESERGVFMKWRYESEIVRPISPAGSYEFKAALDIINDEHPEWDIVHMEQMAMPVGAVCVVHRTRIEDFIDPKFRGPIVGPGPIEEVIRWRMDIDAPANPEGLWVVKRWNGRDFHQAVEGPKLPKLIMELADQLRKANG